VRLRPYALGLAGVAAITIALVAIERRLAIPNLSVVYVLLVLWIGSSAGRWPAVATSLAAFLAYDFFLVPPVGTLTVAGPSELLELVVLLAAALVTGQLAGSLERSREEANRSAAEARGLYSLATDVLRSPELAAALQLVADRAARIPAIGAFGVVAANELLAGNVADAEDVRTATRALSDGRALGCTLGGDSLQVFATRPPRPDALAVLPLTSGGIVFRSDPALVEPEDSRLLAALAALTELLLERRRAAVEADRRRAIEASDSLKSAVLSSLSHELKSPLASLRAGLTALAGAGSGLDGDQRELVLGLDRQALRLDRLLEELLTMSRLEAGARPQLEPLAIAEAAGPVLEQLAAPLGERNLVLAVPADLPQVLGDELQVQRVLTNLLENAVEWSAPGARIELGAATAGDRVVVWVRNDGDDIPPTELQAVFDKFWTRRRDGSGLGLAIVKRIVEAHGGTVEARNLRGGPEFRFTLPVAPVAAPVAG
jgi:two-component system, OmpR family, sensor histidine kinase KdpD